MSLVSEDPVQTDFTPDAAGPVGVPSAPPAGGDARPPDGWTRSALRPSPRRSSGRTSKPRKAPARLKPRPVAPVEVVVGALAGLNDDGEPLVRYPLPPSDCVTLARTTIPLDASQVGHDVVLIFEQGDPARPIVLGVLRRRGETTSVTPDLRTASVPNRPPAEATSEGERLVFSAQREIVLRCGEASITLTRAGKVLIRGAYLLSRSSGVNRIKGGSVQIN